MKEEKILRLDFSNYLYYVVGIHYADVVIITVGIIVTERLNKCTQRFDYLRTYKLQMLLS